MHVFPDSVRVAYKSAHANTPLSVRTSVVGYYIQAFSPKPKLKLDMRSVRSERRRNNGFFALELDAEKLLGYGSII